MKRLLILLGITWTISAATGPAYAQAVNDPIISMKRLSISAGVEREVLRGYENDLAWRVVLPMAYNVLSPQPGAKGIRLSLTARVSQQFDFNQQTECYLGARVSIFRGSGQ